MPFVLPLTDQDAENTRLLDRLTKQQEENQSLRAENAQLKEQLDNETSAEGLDELIIHKQKEQIEKLEEDFAGWKASYDDDIREAREEGFDEVEEQIDKQKEQIEKLKQHQSDTEREMKYMYGYISECGNGWGEFAEHLSHGITGKDITINWSWLKDDFNMFSVVYYKPDPTTGEPIETKTTLIRDVCEIDDIDAGPTPEELEAHKEFFSDEVLESTIKSIEYIKVYDFTDE